MTAAESTSGRQASELNRIPPETNQVFSEVPPLVPDANKLSFKVELGLPALTYSPRSLMPIPSVLASGYKGREVCAPFVHVQRGVEITRRHVPRQRGEALLIPDVYPSYYEDVFRRIDENEKGTPRQLTIAKIASAAYLAFTPKHGEFGHFLLETLPKLLVARELINCNHKHPVIVPRRLPPWTRSYLKILFEEAELLELDEDDEGANLDYCIMPSMLNSGWFHPSFIQLIDKYVVDPLRQSPPSSELRLFIGRSRFRAEAASDFRAWHNEDACRETAVAYGFQVVEPQTVPIQEQIRLFSEATHIIGESSSAMHNALFGSRRAHVLVINCVNHVQTAIAAARNQTIDYLLPEDGIIRSWSNVGSVDPSFDVKKSAVAEWICLSTNTSY